MAAVVDHEALPDRIDGWFTKIDGISTGLFRDENEAFWFFYAQTFIRIDSDVQCKFEIRHLKIRFELMRGNRSVLLICYGNRAQLFWDTLIDAFDSDSWKEADPLYEFCRQMKRSGGLVEMVSCLQKGSGSFDLI
ncbi:MAG: hypothetical protein SF172_09360 [Burkholderiales bacterium]|nr:hypothetical protein [Burkholderiales bacterium]